MPPTPEEAVSALKKERKNLLSCTAKKKGGRGHRQSCDPGSQMCPHSSVLLWRALQIPCSRAAKLLAVPPSHRPDSEIKKRALVPRLVPDSVAQLSQLLCPLFHPVLTVLSKQCT